MADNTEEGFLTCESKSSVILILVLDIFLDIKNPYMNYVFTAFSTYFLTISLVLISFIDRLPYRFPTVLVG